MGHVSLTQLI